MSLQHQQCINHLLLYQITWIRQETPILFPLLTLTSGKEHGCVLHYGVCFLNRSHSNASIPPFF